MTTKEYLKQAFTLEADISSMLKELESIESNATKVTSVLNPNRVEQSTGMFNNRQEDAVVKMIDYKNEINKKIDDLVDLKHDILKLISKVEKPEYRTLLTLRYINLMTFEEIAVQMNYSWRHTIRLHGEALKTIDKTCH